MTAMEVKTRVVTIAIRRARKLSFDSEESADILGPPAILVLVRSLKSPRSFPEIPDSLNGGYRAAQPASASSELTCLYRRSTADLESPCRICQEQPASAEWLKRAAARSDF